MNQLLPIPVVLPLIGAAVSMILGRSRQAQRAVSLAIHVTVLAVAIVIFVRVDRDGIATTSAGGWSAPFGIVLVADRYAALMLVVAAIVLLAVLIYAIGQPGAERSHVGFQSVYLVLTAGVSAAFLTGDLFNLFVAFEMMLTASYVLLTLGGRPEQIRSGTTYIVISLIASALFVSALALLYAATGTVNMADLSEKMATLPPGVRSAFALLLLVVFGIKAALFPLYFWLPDSYPIAPSPVTAIFAGLLTKVGVYAIFRTQTLLFPESTRPAGLLLVVAAATMVFGVLGAIAQDDVKRILSFNIVSHVGYMLMGLGFFTVGGLAAAVFYTVHHIVAKTTLFLSGGLIEHAGGSSSLPRLGGLARRTPLLAALFLLPALNLAGIPPFSGFVGKFALVDAGLARHQYVVVGVSLLVSLLSFYSLLKIWTSAFWKRAPEGGLPVDGAIGRAGGPFLMSAPTAALLAVSLAMAVAAGPLYSFTERAAADLLDPTAYRHVVLGTP
jgi:multicomponent Na+:H+ antiporter subunit D